jgi:mevalonate kinase
VGVSATVTGRTAARLTVPAWSIDVAGDADHRVAAALRALRDALPFDAAGYDLHLDASLPAGAGVGSSAAMAVASARALAEAAGHLLTPDQLFEAAMAAERVFHGNPSGLDHAVAIHGGLMHFVRGNPPRMRPVALGGPFRLLVAQVEAGADTGRMVASVAALREAHPVARALCADIGALVAEAETALTAGDQAAVGRLMNLNHGLLSALGVSTARLDAAVHAARAAGALGAKLTGAGGGGCMVALVTDDTAPAVAAALAPLARALFAAHLQPVTEP